MHVNKKLKSVLNFLKEPKKDVETVKKRMCEKCKEGVGGERENLKNMWNTQM
jgi:hypothetical protein